MGVQSEYSNSLLRCVCSSLFLSVGVSHMIIIFIFLFHFLPLVYSLFYLALKNMYNWFNGFHSRATPCAFFKSKFLRLFHDQFIFTGLFSYLMIPFIQLLPLFGMKNFSDLLLLK